VRRPLRARLSAAIDAMARVGGRCPACYRLIRPGQPLVYMHGRDYHAKCVRYERRK
jgi:hypothetical protein